MILLLLLCNVCSMIVRTDHSTGTGIAGQNASSSILGCSWRVSSSSVSAIAGGLDLMIKIIILWTAAGKGGGGVELFRYYCSCLCPMDCHDEAARCAIIIVISQQSQDQ